MAGSGNQESGKLTKRKANTEHFGGGPSSWRGEAGEAAEESDGGDGFELAAEDPLMVLGPEIMTMILGKLDMRSVAVARLVSRGWQPLASSDRIWAPKVNFPFSYLFCNLVFIWLCCACFSWIAVEVWSLAVVCFWFRPSFAVCT